LYNGNKFPSVPLAYSVNIKDSCGNMKLLSEKIQYEKYNWNICGDLNSLLTCLVCRLATQGFVALCVSGIIDNENVITSIKCPKRESLIQGQNDVANTPLINPEKR
jgi:hypothetical protein